MVFNKIHVYDTFEDCMNDKCVDQKGITIHTVREVTMINDYSG